MHTLHKGNGVTIVKGLGLSRDCRFIFDPPYGNGKHGRRRTRRALDGAFCVCPIFIPSYESTAAKCRICGKPPRQ